MAPPLGLVRSEGPGLRSRTQEHHLGQRRPRSARQHPGVHLHSAPPARCRAFRVEGDGAAAHNVGVQAGRREGLEIPQRLQAQGLGPLLRIQTTAAAPVPTGDQGVPVRRL